MIITLDQLLGGPYPTDEPRGPWPDILADLTVAASIQMPDKSLAQLRHFVATAQPCDWEPIIGTRYGFNAIMVCRTIADTIFTQRGLLL